MTSCKRCERYEEAMRRLLVLISDLRDQASSGPMLAAGPEEWAPVIGFITHTLKEGDR